MKEQSIGIREFKARLSECVREVKRGGTVVVTEHGRRVARLVPDAASLDERLAAMKASGAVLWSGRRLRSGTPAPRARSARTVSQILVDNRG